MQKRSPRFEKKVASKDKVHWTQCPKCRKIRAIIVWAIIVALFYFNFYV